MTSRDWTQPSQDTLIGERVEAGIAVLTLTDPPANTYSYAMMRQLDEAVLRARFDPAVHVILITGAGTTFFCAGANIQMLTQVSPTFKYFFCLHANETLNRLEQTPKVVIAAINGHCVGGGLEVALAADLRFAAPGDYKLGLPEVNLGVLPGTGGTQRMARLLGRAKALELMLEGRTFGVAEAKALGLVTAIGSGEGSFLEQALSYARGFLPPRRAALALGAIKRSVIAGLEVGFTEGLSIERELQQRLFESDDAAEGLRAYGEKRAADFKGT